MAKKINVTNMRGVYDAAFSNPIMRLLFPQQLNMTRLLLMQIYLDNGFEQDRQNLLGDWNNVYNDIEKSYNEQKTQQ
jgi:hypothetical protein